MQLNRGQNISIAIIGIVSIALAIIIFNAFFENPSELSKKQILELELKLKQRNEQLKELEEKLAMNIKSDSGDSETIEQLKAKIRLDSIRLADSKEIKSSYIESQKKQESKINSIIKKTNEYLLNSQFNQSEHDNLFTQLSGLYRIRGLSVNQNEKLRNAIVSINDILIANVIMNKEHANDYLQLLYSTLKKIISSYRTASQVKKLENEIIQIAKKVHEVKFGETLYSIAKQYNISQAEIKLNNFWKLKEDKVKTNDKLIIKQ